jgi:hypothetical protein
MIIINYDYVSSSLNLSSAKNGLNISGVQTQCTSRLGF